MITKYNFSFFTINKQIINDFKKNHIEVELVLEKDLESTLITNYKIDLVYFISK